MVLKFRGPLDQETAVQARRRLLKTVDASSGGILADLSGVGAMDSAGLAVLIEALRHARDRGHRFGLLNPSAAVVALLETMRVSGLFPVEHNTATPLCPVA